MKLTFASKSVAVRSLIDSGFSRRQVAKILGYDKISAVSTMDNLSRSRSVVPVVLLGAEIKALEKLYGARDPMEETRSRMIEIDLGESPDDDFYRERDLKLVAEYGKDAIDVINKPAWERKIGP